MSTNTTNTNTNNTNTTTTNTAVSTPSLLTTDLLVKSGLVTKVTSKSVKAARDVIRGEGGYVPDTASNELVLVAASIIDNAKAAARAGKSAALGLAIIEESEEYKRVLSPYGKPFKKASELFKAMFPGLAESTRRNYLDAGRTVYLPALRGELPKDLMFLAELEPGTVQQACSALKDEQTRKALPAAVKEAAGPTGKVTQTVLKSAIKVAKEKSGAATKADGTTPTDRKDAKASAETAISEMRAALVKLLSPDRTKDETVLSLDADNRVAWDTLLSNALKTPESAVTLVKALKAMKL